MDLSFVFFFWEMEIQTEAKESGTQWAGQIRRGQHTNIALLDMHLLTKCMTITITRMKRRLRNCSLQSVYYYHLQNCERSPDNNRFLCIIPLGGYFDLLFCVAGFLLYLRRPFSPHSCILALFILLGGLVLFSWTGI